MLVLRTYLVYNTVVRLCQFFVVAGKLIKDEFSGNGYIVLHAVCPACRSDTFCNVLPFCIWQNVLTMNASFSPFISN